MKQIILLSLFCTFLHGIAPANAQSNKRLISVNVGLGKALGDGSEYLNLGFSPAIYGFISTNGILFSGLKIGYNRFTIDEEKFKQDFNVDEVSSTDRIWEYLALFRVIPRAKSTDFTKTFFQAGAGIYHNMGQGEVELSENRTELEANQARGGVNGGIGLIVGKLGKPRLEVATNFNYIFTDGTATRYFTFNLGIIFK